MEFSFRPIGKVFTPFKEKFGIPRQPGLISGARGVIRLEKRRELREALRGLESFSHVWVVFVFHAHPPEKWKALVRPPRLGGARKVGVLASRSPHRPNPIGISVVRLVRVSPEAKDGPEIEVAGVDLLDGTPVLDLKPYVPYADCVPKARSGWAADAARGLRRKPVRFSAAAKAVLGSDEDRKLIRDVISQDPRPAFQRDSGENTAYSMRILDFDVHWRVAGRGFEVTSIDRV